MGNIQASQKGVMIEKKGELQGIKKQTKMMSFFFFFFLLHEVFRI
jgi:hypothetical protein